MKVATGSGPNKIEGARILLSLFLISLIMATGLTGGCSSTPPSREEIDEYSSQWKAATAQERGYLLRTDVIYYQLRGKGTDAVQAFLGPPDVAGGKAFTYRLGMLEMGKSWNLRICFDENSLVDAVYATSDDR